MSSSQKNVSWKLRGEAPERTNVKDSATATSRDHSLLYSSYLTQPGTVLGGRATHVSGSQRASSRYPHTVQVLPNQEDAVSMITDPRYTRSAQKNKTSMVATDMNLMLTGVPEEVNGDDESDAGTLKSRDLKKLIKISLIIGKTPQEVARHLRKKENEKKREEKIKENLYADALKVAKNPTEIAAYLLQAKEARKVQDLAEKRDENELDEREEEPAEIVGTPADTSKIEQDDATADSTVPSIQDDHQDVEVKDETCIVKLISVNANDEQEVTFVKDLTKKPAENKDLTLFDDDSSVDEGTIMSTSILQELMADAVAGVGDDPEDVAAYLLQKEREKKMEKIFLEEQVTAAFNAGKSPVEIAKILTQAEERRVKAEETRRAKRANEDLIARALKIGKTPGEVAAIILQAKEEEKPKITSDENDIQVVRCDVKDSQKQEEGVNKSENVVSPTTDWLKGKLQDFGVALSSDDPSIVTEKRSKIEIEVDDLRADLRKAELLKKEIVKLRADLSKAEDQIKVLEEDDEYESFFPVSKEMRLPDDGSLLTESTMDDDDGQQQRRVRGCFSCFV